MASVLSAAGVKEIIRPGGEVAPVDSLKGKVLGLYFSAHWCPPCRGFTPRLSEWFTKFGAENANKDNFELVFLSSDKTQDAFDEYHKEMTFSAVPFSERSAKAKLSSQFKVQGIPTLVIVDADGTLLTTQGRNIVAEDPEGKDFPWRPPSLEELLAGTFQTAAGAEVARDSFKDSVLGIYFSAHWCGPCKAFTPKLVETYNKVRADGKAFEIVFVSSDRDEKSFAAYHGTMPWLALPFGDERVDKLSRHFGVRGIPSLFIVGPDGKVLNDNGRAAVAGDPSGADFPWAPKPFSKLTDAVVDLCNTKPCLIYFGEEDELAAVEAVLKPLADARGAKAAEEGRDLELFHFAGLDDDLADSIRSFAKLGDDQKLVILDVPSQHKYVAKSDALTTDNIAEFAAAFVAGSLEPAGLR